MRPKMICLKCLFPFLDIKNWFSVNFPSLVCKMNNYKQIWLLGNSISQFFALEEIFIFCNENVRKEELQIWKEVPLSHYQLGLKMKMIDS